MLVVYLTWKWKAKHVCMLCWGQKIPAWLDGGNEDETHGPNLRMKQSGQLRSVLFALMLCKSEGYFVWRQSEKKSETMIIFWFNKIPLSDVSWRWRGDVKGELLAACSNLFALFLYYINPILQGFYSSSTGARKDLFLTLLAWFSFWFWDFFFFFFPLKQWKSATARNRMLSKALMLLVVLESLGCLVDRSFLHALG